MSSVVINDLVEELNEENKRLLNELLFANKCLKVLTEFKSFIDSVFDKININLNENQCKTYQEFNESLKTILIKFPEISAKKTKITLKSKTNVNKQQINDTNALKKHKQKARKSIAKPVDSSVGRNVVADSSALKVSTESQASKSKERKTLLCLWPGCGYETKDGRYLESHMNGHNGIEPYVCGNIGCGKRFNNSKYFRKHQSIHCEFRTENIVGQYICDDKDCGKPFKTKISLQLHQKRRHTKERPFACDRPNCNYKTVTSQCLKRHQEFAHTEERPLMCPVGDCHKSFKNDKDLKSHMIRHTSERKYRCDHEGCGKAFKTKKELNCHVRGKHLGVKFQCEWPGCEFESSYRGCLQTHMSGVHSTESNFVCHWPACGKRFKLKARLTDHLKTHSNDKRYACHWPGCQYRTHDSSNFSKHTKAHKINLVNRLSNNSVNLPAVK